MEVQETKQVAAPQETEKELHQIKAEQMETKVALQETKAEQMETKLALQETKATLQETKAEVQQETNMLPVRVSNPFSRADTYPSGRDV